MLWWLHGNAPPPEMTLGWQVYYGIVFFCLIMQCISMAGMLVALVAYLRRRCLRLADVVETVAAIVPCYLPNEVDIIKDTLRHLLEKMTHVRSLTVYLVYNTPHRMAVEAELAAMAEEAMPEGRRLVVQECPGSRSKAENLNFVAPRLAEKYTVVYDADHHPDPDSLALAVRYLEATGVDCVQGSTYIRQGSFVQRCLTNAEFFVVYFVALPAMQAVSGTGFFGGANGVWKTASLQLMRFNEKALCEDIDCFARAILGQGLRFRFLPECSSGELLPAGAKAFWNQRLRWAMGWDQVTAWHAGKFWKAKLPLRTRIGLYYIFVARWFSQLAAIIIVVFNFQSAFQRWQAGPSDHAVPPKVFSLQLVSFHLYMVFICYALFMGLTRVRAFGPSIILCVASYFCVMPFYVVFNSLLLMVSLYRVTRGRSQAWVVTSRASGIGDTAGLMAPLLDRALDMAPADQGSRVLAVGWVAQGAVAGCLLGALLGQRQVERPLFGWVPFGLGATTVTVTDGHIVVLGLVLGMTASLASLVFSLKFSGRG